MDFTTDIYDFPSEVHKMIYCGAREMTRPERSLADMDNNELRASCEAYYDFLMELYSDMYEYPEKYEMPVYALEKFLGGNKPNVMKRKYPSKTKSLIARTRNCAVRYLQTLCCMAYLGELDGEQLILTQENIAEIEKTVNTSTSPVSLEKRLAAFERVGLLSTENAKDETRIFRCANHSNMFHAMILLAEKTKMVCSGFNFYLFTKADFRNITQNYIPTVEDYIAPLPEGLRKTATALHELAVSVGCKVAISTFLKINYKYKGKEVLLIDTYEGALNVRITEVYAWEDRSFFMDRLLAQTQERKRYADRHLWRCTACATSHIGQQIEFLGRNNRVCGGGQIGFIWNNPSIDELAEMEFFIKTRCEMQDYLKSSEKAHQ